MILQKVLRNGGSARFQRARHVVRLPVLMYHHVGRSAPSMYPDLTVSPEQFEREMRWLARWRYVGIRPSDWLAWCRGEKSLPKKPMLLTFDDGYADITEYALPVLRRYGFSAVVFIVTGLLGRTNVWDEVQGSRSLRLMSAEQIRDWAAQGIEFGAHSRTHPHLNTLSGTELAEEVAGSVRDLADLLGDQVVSFAYPYGDYNQPVYHCVRSTVGLAFTVEEGLNDVNTDPHLLRRGMPKPEDFWGDLAGHVGLGWKGRLYARVIRGKDRILGRR